MAEKLIRDLVAQGTPNVRIAEPSEMRRLLGRKLVEEAQEVLDVLMLHDSVMTPRMRRDRLSQEIGDVKEVCSAIMSREHVPWIQEVMARRAKLGDKGGFSLGRVLTNVQRSDPEFQLRVLVEDLMRELINMHRGYTTKSHNEEMVNQLHQRAEQLGCIGTVA